MEEPQTIARELKVTNKYGIHARPAALLVKAAGKFASEILIGKKGAEVSAKSIMGLLTIEGHHGAKLHVHATGEDAKAAIEEIAGLFENKFFEE